jgi:hypothetical protein
MIKLYKTINSKDFNNLIVEQSQKAKKKKYDFSLCIFCILFMYLLLAMRE